MKEDLRVVVLLGFFAISSLVWADAPSASEIVHTQRAKNSALPSYLWGFKFSESPLGARKEDATRTSSPLNDDFEEVVRMPKFVVTARRDIPQENEMLTEYGQLQLAKDKFTTPLYRATFGPLSQIAGYYFNILTIFNGWHPNDAEAMTLYSESKRVQLLQDFDDLCHLEELRDPRTSDELQRMRQKVWRTGVDSLYWDPSAGPTGILIGRHRR